MRDNEININKFPHNIINDNVNASTTNINTNNYTNNPSNLNININKNKLININNHKEGSEILIEYLKLNDNSNLIQLNVKKDLLDEEEFREFNKLKNYFVILKKLSIIKNDLSYCLINSLVKFLNHKDLLTINLLTEITNQLKVAFKVSSKHSNKGIFILLT